MKNMERQRHTRRWLVLLVIALLAVGLLGCSPSVFATTAPAQPARIDPTCAGHGCDGTNPYATMCAGHPFDRERVVISAPITSEGQLFGMVQEWYSPLCQTTWARTVSLAAPVLLEAMIRLPRAHFMATAQGARAVLSPQAFAPTLVSAAFGELLRNGRLATGCASLASPLLCDV